MQNILLQFVLPAIVLALVTSFWFSAISRTQAEKRLGKLREQHASDREQLNKDAERSRSDVLQKAGEEKVRIMERAHADREKLVRKTHKEVLRTERSANRRASMKVGLAFVGMTALGIVFLISELLTLGLMTITTAGGALGGYMLRWRQGRDAINNSINNNGAQALELSEMAPEEPPPKVPALERKIPPDPKSMKSVDQALLAEPDRRHPRWSDFFKSS